MNLANLEKRVQALKSRLDALQPKESAPPLILTICCEINRNAPSGTKSNDDGVELPEGMRSFAMIPPGCSQPPPDGVPTFEEWSRRCQSLRKGDNEHVS
jgi:hypothetical protein